AAGDAGDAGEELGQAKQKTDQAGTDLADGDQDTASKGSNVGHTGADATRDVDQALKDLGILDGDDSTLSDIADGIDDVTDDIFGKKKAPTSLPPVRYRFFFGKKESLLGGLESMGEGLLDDAMSAGDSLIEQGANAIGGVAADYLGDDPMSSMLSQFSPFKEDPKELDEAESRWRVAAVRCEEGLSFVWRCELMLVAPEIVDTALEAALDAESSAGGLIDQVAGPIKSAIDTIKSLESIAGGNEDGSDEQARIDELEDQLAEDEARLKEVEAERDDYAAKVRQAEALGLPEEEIQKRKGALFIAELAVQAQKRAVEDARAQLQAARVQARKKRSPAAKVADRIRDAKDAFGRLEDDPLGAMNDLIFGEGKQGWPDGPVYRNVPLDPADFLGQTASLRISRELPADPYPYSARYLTGVVVEMEDLGQRSNAPQGTTRTIRLVLAPELAKLAWRRDHRVFQDMPALHIVREVLRSAGVYGFLPGLPGVGLATDALGSLVEQIPFVGSTLSDTISGQHIRTMPPSRAVGANGPRSAIPESEWTAKREMCVQYGETDLDFVKRLLEEEGIHFTFEHRRGFERLVL
ncbi:MAG: hypothetical protein K8H88_31015, partial [Sandaracinaceae bacterium]|nr:hypothetical protein [Sandaracinaceae bacterium]